MGQTTRLAEKVHIGVCDNCLEKKKLARWGSAKECHACYMYQKRTGRPRPVGRSEGTEHLTEEQLELLTLKKRYAAQVSANTKLRQSIDSLQERVDKYRKRNRKLKKILEEHDIDYY